MASYHNYPGIGESFAKQVGFTQAVRAGNLIKLSGQAGWDETGAVTGDVATQIRVSVENVDKALKAVDPSLGWQNVIQVRSYHTSLDESAMALADEFKRLKPQNGPAWMTFQVEKLLVPGSVIELEVEAYIQ